MRNISTILVLILVLCLPGCDKELLAGGQGDVEVEATDRPPQEASSHLAPRGADGPSAQVVPVLFAGTVEIEATVSLMHTSGDVALVVPTPVSAILTIGGSQSVPLGRRQIPGGRYTVARVSFTKVRATLTAGPGVVGTKVVDVDIGVQPRTVEGLVDLVVGVTELERLQVDLNSSAWLLLEQGGLVDPTDFGQLVRIQVVS